MAAQGETARGEAGQAAVSDRDVIVIGGGVIGLSCALALTERGFHVTLLEREGVAAGASAGNAGAFALTAVIPLARPGVMRRAPYWLIDPAGPLSIPPSYAPALAPWLWRFWRASRRDRFEASAAAQAALMRHAAARLTPMTEAFGLEDLVFRDGQLQLYDSAASYRAAEPERRLKTALGVGHQRFESAEALAELQPGLSPRFRYGVYSPSWARVADPLVWTRRLAERLKERGGRIEIAATDALSETAEGACVRLADGGERRAARILVAAGAWSHRLARTLGQSIPLETERGYNTTLPSGAFDLRTHISFEDHGFVVSRIGNGVRVGGAVELAGLRRPPNYARSAAMLKKAKAFLPALRVEGGGQWMGHRPSTPDSLPVLGPARPGSRILYAFGHGHLGLTQSLATADLIAATAAGERPAVDLAPFRAGRF
ncbi:MAG: FAD-binding oxidoreductase [Pseudomonadota bacterium]